MDCENEFVDKSLFTLPIQHRENSRNEAREWRVLLDEVIAALQVGRRDASLAHRVSARKEFLLDQLTSNGRRAHLLAVHRRALYLIERATGISAEPVMEQIKSRMAVASRSPDT